MKELASKQVAELISMQILRFVVPDYISAEQQHDKKNHEYISTFLPFFWARGGRTAILLAPQPWLGVTLPPNHQAGAGAQYSKCLIFISRFS